MANTTDRKLSEVLAEQIAPFGGQATAGQPVDLSPLAVFGIAFSHHRVAVRFEAQVAPADVAEDAPETVVGSGMIGAAPGEDS